MFFTDPRTAFTNIGLALLPGARLVLLVWQDGNRQEWATTISEALSDRSPAPIVGDPFSLADPLVFRDILGTAGFADVEVCRAQ